MKCSKGAVGAIVLVLASLGIGPLDAREAALASQIVAAAQKSNQQCLKACRARYRDCRHLKQLPLSECQGIYRDCTQYTCTGSGPG